MRYLHDLLAKAYALLMEYEDVQPPRGRVVKLREIRDARRELKVRLGGGVEGTVTVVYESLPLVYLLFDERLAPIINPLDVRGRDGETILLGYKRTVRERRGGRTVRVRKFVAPPLILLDGAAMLNSPMGPVASAVLKSVLSDEAYEAVQRVARGAAEVLKRYGLPPDPSFRLVGIPLHKQVDGLKIYGHLYVRAPGGGIYSVSVRKPEEGGYALRVVSERRLPEFEEVIITATPTSATIYHSKRAPTRRPATPSEVETAIRLAQSIVTILSALLVYKRLFIKECERACVDYSEYFGERGEEPPGEARYTL